MRNYSLRVLGAADDVEEYRGALRGMGRRLGSRFVTVRPDAGDILVNIVYDGRRRGTRVDRMNREARQILPPELHEAVVAEEAPDRPHEISAELLEDMRRERTVIPGAVQAAEDLEAWEEFLRAVGPAAVLELGTATGAFSKWLNERVEWFRTIDVGTPDPATPGFVRLDVWDRPDDVRALISDAPRPFILYCDNGDKPREVETFAPELQVGDFLAVHDLGTEIFEQHIPPAFTERLARGLTGFYERRGTRLARESARMSAR